MKKKIAFAIPSNYLKQTIIPKKFLKSCIISLIITKISKSVAFLNDFVVMSINKQHQQQLQNLKQFRQQQYEYIVYRGSTKGSPRRRPGRSS